MPRRRQGGRPTLLASPKRDTLLTAIRSGNRLQAAARFAGIAPATVEEWMRRGEGHDNRSATRIYREFVADVKQAEAHAELYAVAQIRQNMPRDYSAAKFWLEKMLPETWGPKAGEQPVVTGQVAPQISGSQVIFVTQDQLARAGLELLGQRRLEGLPEGTDAVSLAELTVGPEDEPS